MKRIVSFLFLFVFLFPSCSLNHSPSHPKAPVYTLTLLKSEGSEEVYKEYYNKGDKWYYNKECTNVIPSDFLVELPKETTISVNLEYNGGEIVNSAQAPQDNKLTSSVTAKGFYVKADNVEIDIFEYDSERKLYSLSMPRSITGYAKYQHTPEKYVLPKLEKSPEILLFYENNEGDYFIPGNEYPFIKDENLSAFFINSDTCYKLTVRQDKKEDLFYYYRPAEDKWHETQEPTSSVIKEIPDVDKFAKAHQYSITYHANTPDGVSATVPDKKEVKGQRILNVNGIVDDNNTFIGGIYEDTLLSAEYIDYTITQDDIPSILCDSEYYEFECWVDKGPESKETITQGSVVDGNKNYYAKWNKIEPVTFTFKDPAWFTSDENGTGVDENTRSVNAEMSVWIDQADDKCVIRRTKNTVAEGEVYGGFTLSYPSNIGTFNVIGVPSRHGYAFKGWASSAEDAIKGIIKYPVSNGACLVTDKNDTSLWAVWGNDGDYWQIKISPYMPNLGSDVKPNPPDGVLYREILLPAKGYKYPGAKAQLMDDTTLGTVDKDFYISEHLITGGLIEYLKQFKKYIGNIELPSIKYSSSEKQNIYSIGSRQPEGGYNYLQPALTVNMYTAVLIANAVTARRNLFENIDYTVGLTPAYTKVSSLTSESPTWDDAVKTFEEAKELVDYCLSQGHVVYNGKGTGFRLPTDAERMFAFKAIPNLSSVWKKSEVQGNEGESIKASLFPQFQRVDQASGDRNPASNDKDATLNAYCYTFRSSNGMSQPILDVYMKDSKLPNNIGAYHMSGLAGEWVDTPYSSTDYLVMGGSWFASGTMMRTGYRNHMTPDTNTGFIGLRLVRNK